MNSIINLSRIPNPDETGKEFDFSIIIGTQEKWVTYETAGINKEEYNVAVATQVKENAKLLAQGQEFDGSTNKFDESTKVNYNPFLTSPNPDQYIINEGATKKQIVINKIKHKLTQKVYAMYVNIQAAQQEGFCDTLSTLPSLLI